MTHQRTSHPLRFHLLAALAAIAVAAAWPTLPSALAVDGEPREATLELSDDDAGAALFPAGAPLAPGDRRESCLAVTYRGDGPAEVALFSTVAGTGLAEFIEVTVEVGSGGSFGDCDGFVPEAVAFSGTLAELGAHRDFATGIRAWTPETSGSVTYRFTATLADDDRAQGLSASASFEWEARTG